MLPLRFPSFATLALPDDGRANLTHSAALAGRGLRQRFIRSCECIVLVLGVEARTPGRGGGAASAGGWTLAARTRRTRSRPRPIRFWGFGIGVTILAGLRDCGRSGPGSLVTRPDTKSSRDLSVHEADEDSSRFTPVIVCSPHQARFRIGHSPLNRSVTTTGRRSWLSLAASWLPTVKSYRSPSTEIAHTPSGIGSEGTIRIILPDSSPGTGPVRARIPLPVSCQYSRLRIDCVRGRSGYGEK